MPNLKFVALPVSEIIGGTPKIWAVPGYAHAPFLPNFQGALARVDPANIPAKFKVRSLSVPAIIGGTRKIWEGPGYAHAPFFSQIFKGLLFGWTL